MKMQFHVTKLKFMLLANCVDIENIVTFLQHSQNPIQYILLIRNYTHKNKCINILGKNCLKVKYLLLQRRKYFRFKAHIIFYPIISKISDRNSFSLIKILEKIYFIVCLEILYRISSFLQQEKQLNRCGESHKFNFHGCKTVTSCKIYKLQFFIFIKQLKCYRVFTENGFKSAGAFLLV